MMSTISKILMPTDEEEAEINAGILFDPDSFALNQQELERLKPVVNVLPKIVTAYQRVIFNQSNKLAHCIIAKK